MRWVVKDAELESFTEPSQGLTQTSIALVKVRDYGPKLLKGEKTMASKMNQSRFKTFSSGRYAAHLAQEAISAQPKGILREGRAPIWPLGQMGAITHSKKYAGAIVSTELRGVGLDFEEVGRIQPKLYAKLFTKDEESWLRQQTRPEASTIIFSAKEAVYKGIFPILKRYVGFQEVEIELDWNSARFDVRYLEEDMFEVSELDTEGFWYISGSSVLTVVKVK